MQSQKNIELMLGHSPSSICFVSSLQELFSMLVSTDMVVLDRAIQDNFSFQSLLDASSHLVMNGGELVKTQSSVREITDAFFQYTLLRTSTVTAVGGGAICDSVAFAASLYMRGVDCVLVPTTLLAMVDASIGGKTAINAYHRKNIIGSFYPPKQVIVCPEFLSALPQRHYISGIAEIIKAGMLYDPVILSMFETLVSQSELSDDNKEHTHTKDVCSLLRQESHSAVLLELIERAVLVKKMVVETDFKEQNIRSFLNLGHTFAHAIESNAQKKGLDMLHGEAVGLGIRSALKLGERLAMTESAYASRIYALLDAIGFLKEYTVFSMDDILSAMKHDKKVDEKGLRFILQKQQGETEIVYVEETIVKEVLLSMNISS